MSDITLTKEQINKLFIVYDHFKFFDDFTVTLSQDGKVSVKFEMDKVDSKKKFIEQSFR